MRDRLERLKTHLARARDLSGVLREFFDLVETPGFLDLGERVEDRVLEEILAVAADQLDGGPVQDVLLVRLPGHGLVHGAFALGERMGSLLYFEDLRMGLLGAVEMTTGEIRTARFTASRPQGPTPSPN